MSEDTNCDKADAAVEALLPTAPIRELLDAAAEHLSPHGAVGTVKEFVDQAVRAWLDEHRQG